LASSVIIHQTAANMSHLPYLGLRKMTAKYFEHTLANQSVVSTKLSNFALKRQFHVMTLAVGLLYLT